MLHGKQIEAIWIKIALDLNFVKQGGLGVSSSTTFIISVHTHFSAHYGSPTLTASGANHLLLHQSYF